MKFPKTFRMEKNLDDKIQELLEHKDKMDHNPAAVKEILKRSRKFVDNDERSFFLEDKYLFAKNLVDDISYTYEDLRVVSSNLELQYLHKYDGSRKNMMTYLQKTEYNLGLYLSALANKLLTKEDVIVLEPNFIYRCMGAYLEKGTLVVDADVGNNAGFGMLGGNLLIWGNADDSTGCNMQGGEMEIEGSSGNNTGTNMEGGIIRVSGLIKTVAPTYNKGLIIQGEKILRE